MGSSSADTPDICLLTACVCYETGCKTRRNKESGTIFPYLKLGSDQAKNARFVSVTEPRTAVLPPVSAAVARILCLPDALCVSCVYRFSCSMCNTQKEHTANHDEPPPYLHQKSRTQTHRRKNEPYKNDTKKFHVSQNKLSLKRLEVVTSVGRHHGSTTYPNNPKNEERGEQNNEQQRARTTAAREKRPQKTNMGGCDSVPTLIVQCSLGAPYHFVAATITQ